MRLDRRDRFDFSPFDVIVVFLLPAALEILLPKFRECLARGARIASYWCK